MKKAEHSSVQPHRCWEGNLSAIPNMPSVRIWTDSLFIPLHFPFNQQLTLITFKHDADVESAKETFRREKTKLESPYQT